MGGTCGFDGLSRPAFCNISCNDIYKISAKLICYTHVNNLFVMNTILLIILVRMYVAVCLDSFGYISICRSHVSFEREFFLRSHVSLLLCILRHPIVSLNFSFLWREQSRSAHSSTFFSRSYIGSISRNYSRRHFQSKTFVKLKVQPNPPFICDCSYEDLDF